MLTHADPQVQAIFDSLCAQRDAAVLDASMKAVEIAALRATITALTTPAPDNVVSIKESPDVGAA